jgi:hypothetical protein
VTVVDEQISEQLAELVRIVPEPVAPFGYGRDLSCTTELDPALAEVDPFSPRAVAEALVRRLTTPHGSLLDDPDYGEDITGAENRGTTAADLAGLATRIKNEVTKDDRVDTSEVRVVADSAARTLTISLRVTLRDPSSSDFELVLACSNGTVLLEAMQ